ncbi:Fc.00g104300.m01.CDS01 [Cosmosporella sp. VM-42]
MAKAQKLTRLHHRMPTVFGPLPGPRQSFDGYRRDGSASTSVEAFITFKTQQSTLADLLPTGFAFQKMGQDAYVTLAPKRLDNLEWLAGRGYNLLSFYIHGIKYTPPSGKESCGTFLPVLWEDMADPIISGREELGFPKLFADISITHKEDSYKMTASWQGSQFAEFAIENLQDTESGASPLAPPEAGIEDGLLLHRDIPSVGRPGSSEAGYPVFIAYNDEKEVQPAKLVRRFTSTNGVFRWFPLGWQELPTLHHIVSRLSQVPALTIVACGLTEKVGMADFSTARRADREVNSHVEN